MTTAQRWLSLAEFVLGSAVVIGHNVYHVIPSAYPVRDRSDFAAGAGRRLVGSANRASSTAGGTGAVRLKFFLLVA
jgi:hypothetical protein